ncbi:equilibrative nucleoside transporter 4-like isoform X2 [Ptychodera flava]|uniref:equilibrative nucleoside transporter 4-like isoform X2 n=1 Tax=Ptychodera flava TaxID=63121 RepID=UPI003969C52A
MKPELMYERIDMDDIYEEGTDSTNERGRIIPDSSSEKEDRENGVDIRALSTPKDKHNLIYCAMVLSGIGFLLPYNSFISAVDYFHVKYPGSTIVFDMSLTYILVAFGSVLLNNILVETFSLHTRITFGYIVAFVALTFVAIFEIWLEVFTHDFSYVVVLIAVALVALGCTAQQSSFYGYASMLPKRYTQGIMTGESAAGLLTSINRIITKLLLRDQQINTLIFFGISIFFVVLCLISHHVIRRTKFIRYHMEIIKNAKKSREEKCVADEDEHARVASSQEPENTEVTSYNVNGDPADPAQSADGDMTIDVQMSHKALKKYVGIGTAIKRGVMLRYEASRTVWTYMLSIGVAYFVTLCLFPGIETEVINCTLGEWMPVILMALFNGFDFVGKIIAAIPYEWKGGRLVLASSSRIVLIPLMMICVAPREAPILSHSSWSMIFSILLGITNGYFGSVPMILAPGKVPNNQKELTGNIMTLSYNIGLTTGSGVAYLLNYILGPSTEAMNRCINPAITIPPIP